MGNSGSIPNCALPAEGIEISADEDIIGYGALAAFFATAVATIGAIIFGYLSDSLPDSYLNDLDRAVISAYQEGWLSGAIASPFRGWNSFTSALRRFWGSQDSPSPPRPAVPRDVRQEALTRFLLVLSDQQLVTGLAILLGAVANLNTLSWYEFSVALSLSWFSSTTHLATLDVLQEYFRLHTVIRNWRVGGMISVLILLTFALLTVSVTGGYGSPVPLACYFSKYSVYPGLEQVNIDPNPIVLAANCLTLYVLLSGYFLRIKNLYVNSHILYWHIWKLTTGRFSVQRLHLSVTEHRDIFDTAMNGYQSSLRRKNLEKVYGATGWKRWYFIGFYRYDESFLSKLPIVGFSFTYGLSQVVVFRWINLPKLSPSVKSMNFGQITALFLLVLPIFAAAEIYYDYRNEEPSSSTSSINAEESEDTTNRCVNETQASAGYQSPNSLSRSPENYAPVPRSSTAVKKEYTEKIPALEKYFCREMTKVRKVENLATTEETHQALILHKESLLQALKDCQELKKQIDPRPSIMIFFSNLIISIAMGVLLNINNYRAVSAAVLLFLIRLSFAIIREIQKTRRCFAALPDIFLELTKDYTSISPHRVDGGSMDPIQELSRSRSEAVATSVPGHHQLEVTASNVMSNEAALSVAPDVPLGSDMLVTHGLQPYTA